MTAPPSAFGGGATGIPIPSGLPPEGEAGLMGSATGVVIMATKWRIVAFLKLLLSTLPTNSSSGSGSGSGASKNN